jgi:tetratricopeptide (TPR) repeat protein
MRSGKIKSYLALNISFSFKKGLIVLLLVSSFLSANAAGNNITFDSANAAYAKGNYDKAIKLYETITNTTIEASELYFNLGNAYYKTNNIGQAILNYERAKKLAPDDEDIHVNLKLANQKVEDKIDAAPQLFLTEWKNGLVDLMSEKEWSILCILVVIVSLILISIYIISNRRSLKQLGFFGGSVFILFAVVLFFIAQHKYNLTKTSSDAIITTAAVTVTGSPNEKGTKLFILHEGTKVMITQEDGDWTEIKIANGNVGWVKSKMVTAI